MNLSDPIADMFTRIRNSSSRKHVSVMIPYSKVKERIAELLLKEGFIQSYKVEAEKREMHLTLKYYSDKIATPVIRSIQRVSRPGLRKYSSFNELKPVLNGQGVYIVSTTAGIISDNVCREKQIGGEVLGRVY